MNSATMDTAVAVSDAELLSRYAAAPTPDLQRRLVDRLMPFARSLALRYNRGGEPLDDLIQVASFGLVKAIKGFDPEMGRPFAAYATPTILGELRRHFRDNVWNLRLPRGLQEFCMRLEAATQTLSKEYGRTPTPAELADHLEVSVEDVLEGLEAATARKTRSIDAPVGGDDGTELAVVETLGSEDSGFEAVDAQLAAETADLDDRELMVLKMRLEQGMTQAEVGEQIGVSQMQVSRISRKAVWKLLHAVRGGDEAPGPVPRTSAQPSF
ncbi:MAG: polymerase sigma-B factor [Solirubrobacterales bacterium]|jgi:RNA polymerase sigma-B factor|nr:polymerase sigma-B factor [Solirubrobacterales bacterium]